MYKLDDIDGSCMNMQTQPLFCVLLSVKIDSVASKDLI